MARASKLASSDFLSVALTEATLRKKQKKKQVRQIRTSKVAVTSCDVRGACGGTHDGSVGHGMAQAMTIGRCQVGKLWRERGPGKLKREIFLRKVVEAGIAGLEACVLMKYEEKRLDSHTVKYLRAQMQGRARTVHADKRITALSNLKALQQLKRLPVRAELAVRREKRLQSMRRHRIAHRQTMVAIFGHLPSEPRTLDENGQIYK